MGDSKARRNKKQRRQTKQVLSHGTSAKKRHTSLGGRKGTIKHKQMQGFQKERKRKPIISNKVKKEIAKVVGKENSKTIIRDVVDLYKKTGYRKITITASRR